jgi:hypothetical protein
MLELTATLATRPALHVQDLPLPPPLRAATARLGVDELALLECPSPGERPGSCPPPVGPRLEALRAVHACYAAAETPAAWLGGVIEALQPIARGAPWFAWCDGVVGRLGAPGSTSPFPGKTLFPALVEAVGLECYRDLLRPHPAVQLLSHRLRCLPPALERRVAALLRARGVADAVLLFGGGIARGAVAVGLVVAPGHHPASRTMGHLRHVAGHLGTARALRDELAGGALVTGAARSLARAATGALLGRGAFRWTDPRAAAQLWRALGEGRYALLDHWLEEDRLRVLTRRCQGPGDPAALRPLEWTMLALVAAGMSRRRARERLGIMPRTAALCLSGAAARLRCGSVGELTLLAAPALTAR